MRVMVYGPLRSATGGKTVELPFEGGTVRDALETLVAEYPRARDYLLDDDDLRSSVRIVRDGQRVDLDDSCGADDELDVFPAMQGGVT